MYKIFYTTTENIDAKTKRPIDKSLILSIETDSETLEEGQVVISRWDLEEYKQIQINNKKSELEMINKDYEDKVNALTIETPDAEVKTWSEQKMEAKAYILDNTTLTPLIDSIAITRGVPKELLVTKILEKADIYANAVGILTGERQRLEDLINAKYQG